MDFFFLLFHKPEPKPWSGSVAATWELEQVKCQKADKYWDSWEFGFTIYLAVVSPVQLWKGAALVKYFETIYKAYKAFGGSAWLCYNESGPQWVHHYLGTERIQSFLRS